MKIPVILILALESILLSCSSDQQMERLMVSGNGRYFMDEDGDPFFWLGDTGWLLFNKLDRKDAEKYLENRRQKGFNVIQVMIAHSVDEVNVYGDSAFYNKEVSEPWTTEGADFTNEEQYDFWDHVDFIVNRAAEKGLYMAMVPVWGSNVKAGKVSRKGARLYAAFLANRYKDRPNIIWVNGGDTFGSDSTIMWKIIGNTLRLDDPNHLITFHPRGRKMSSEWFHNDPWLDFNMFQSGHRRYDQDTARESYRFGPDNWRYVKIDYDKKPVKPTLDGEPSYENIPEGLHDTAEPLWKARDARRYAYWSVFAGSAGHTYGDNSVMQMHKPTDESSAYGATDYWFDAINDPGAAQMIHLKNLMLSRPYFERIPDQSMIADQGEKYDYQAATKGTDYAFIYTYNGRNIRVNMGKIGGENVKASWLNPRDGSIEEIGIFPNIGLHEFDPPGEKENGADWILILDKL